MKLLYVRRKQTSKALPDGRWHIVTEAKKPERIVDFFTASPRVREEWQEQYAAWARQTIGPRKTLCGQAYIPKYWHQREDGTDGFRECCEECWVEGAVWRLRGN